MTDDKKSTNNIPLAQLVSKLPKDAVRDITDFLLRVFGPLAEGGDYASEQIRLFRFRSAIKTLQTAKQIADQSNIALNELPLKFLVPFLENCSLEEDDSELIEQWARLLVSASTDYDPRHSTFVNILSQISSVEVKFLKRIYEQQYERGFDRLTALLDIYRENRPAYWGEKSVSLDEAYEAEGRFLVMAGTGSSEERQRHWDDKFEITTRRTIQSLLVLERQNLIKIRTDAGPHIETEKGVYVVQAALTPLGYDFVQACEDVTAEP